MCAKKLIFPLCFAVIFVAILTSRWSGGRGVNKFYAECWTLISILKSTMDAVLKNISGLCTVALLCSRNIKFRACFLGRLWVQSLGMVLGFECWRFAGVDGGQVTGSSSAGFHSATCQHALSGILRNEWLSRINPGKRTERGASRDVPAEASLWAVLLAP